MQATLDSAATAAPTSAHKPPRHPEPAATGAHAAPPSTTSPATSPPRHRGAALASLKPSDSTASLADAPGATEGGVKDVTLPGHPLSRTKPLREAAAAGGVPLLWLPMLNRGTAFTAQDRRALNLEGLLPSAVESLEAQAARVMHQLRDECADDFGRYTRLQWLRCTNSHLFYFVVMHNLEFVAPLIYTPTVGTACECFSSHYRQPLGLFIDATPGGGMRGRFADVVKNWPSHMVQICVITDGSRILGLGDLGVGGLGISAGKIDLYISGGGFSPEHSLPVILDCGTNNDALLGDPFYLGARTRRLSDEDTAAAVAELCDAIHAHFGPSCLIQFEDFATEKAFKILEAQRSVRLCFNDDIQGTGAVVCSGFLNGMRAQGTDLRDARLVFFGAGSSAVGVADTICAAVAAETGEEHASVRTRMVWMCDSKGLITADRGDKLAEHKRPWARPPGEVEPGSLPDLPAIIRAVRPHALVGLSATGGAWGRDVIEAVCEAAPPPAAASAGGPGPLIFPLSNPTSNAEVSCADAVAWSGGHCLFAAGSPFPPAIAPDGRTIVPGQGNNAFIFPGVGFGAVMAKSARVSDGMLLAAARAVAAAVPPADLAAGTLYPQIRDLRSVSLRVAAAVANASWDEGLAGVDRPADVEAYLAARMWSPEHEADVDLE